LCCSVWLTSGKAIPSVLPCRWLGLAACSLFRNALFIDAMMSWLIETFTRHQFPRNPYSKSTCNTHHNWMLTFCYSSAERSMKWTHLVNFPRSNNISVRSPYPASSTAEAIYAPEGPAKSHSVLEKAKYIFKPRKRQRCYPKIPKWFDATHTPFFQMHFTLQWSLKKEIHPTPLI
jgi:hypothetical protein